STSDLLLLLLSPFFLTPPRPPSSTLFPYTTLFRSEGDADTAPGRRILRRLLLARRSSPLCLRRQHRRTFCLHLESRCRHPRKQVDRKSTRLNSSHGSISYAVFCLKKKKQKMKKLDT